MTKLKNAVKLHQDGKISQALGIYQELLKSSDDPGTIQQLMGILYGQDKQYKNSITHLEKAKKILGPTPDILDNLATAHLNNNNHNAAEKLLKQAVTQFPQHYSAYNNLGLLYLKQNKHTQAAIQFQQAATCPVTTAACYYNHALALQNQPDTDQQIPKLLTKALTIEPDHWPSLSMLAQFYHSHAELQQAHKLYTQALTLNPEHPETLHRLGCVALELTNHQDAIKHFKHALRINSDDQESRYNLGLVFLQQRELDLALECFLAIATPQNFDANYNAGVVYSYQGRYQDACAYLERALAIQPNNHAVHVNLGACHLKRGDQNSAITHYTAATSLNSQDETSKFMLAALTNQEHQYTQAPQQYVTNLFDEYADKFDHHLLEHLKYQTPTKIIQALRDQCLLAIPDLSRNILDLGCGTGIIGPSLKPYAKQLIGVDLSTKMLRKAAERNCYSHLISDDIINYLAECNRTFDLITLVDTLPYLGDLEKLWEKIDKTTNAHSIIAFSTEVHPENISYRLTNTGRYTHNDNYIKEITEKHGFNIIHTDHHNIRLQANKPVRGSIFIARRAAD